MDTFISYTASSKLVHFETKYVSYKICIGGHPKEKLKDLILGTTNLFEYDSKIRFVICNNIFCFQLIDTHGTIYIEAKFNWQHIKCQLELMSDITTYPQFNSKDAQTQIKAIKSLTEFNWRFGN
jgi:hypothetical protein